MKLRTKLLLTTALIFLLVFAVCIGGLLSCNVQNTKQLLTDNVVAEQGLIAAHFLRQLSGGDELPQGLAERSRAEYVFRRISLNLPTDAWYVLLREDEVLRNDSGVAITPAEQAVSGVMRLNEKQYCISKAPCTWNTSTYTIAVIRDVTEQMAGLYRRTVISAAFASGLLLIGGHSRIWKPAQKQSPKEITANASASDGGTSLVRFPKALTAWRRRCRPMWSRSSARSRSRGCCCVPFPMRPGRR